jgi:hypothetical protein
MQSISLLKKDHNDEMIFSVKDSLHVDESISESNDDNEANLSRNPKIKTPRKRVVVNQAIRALGKVNMALHHPIDSFGEAVKKKKKSVSTSLRKESYTTLPPTITTATVTNRLRQRETESTTRTDVCSNESVRKDTFIGGELVVKENSTDNNVLQQDLNGVSNPYLEKVSFLLTDMYIFWTVIFSTLVLQLYENWEKLLSNHVTLGFVVGLMMLAFAVGLETDKESFMREIKLRILAREIVDHEEALQDNSSNVYVEHEDRVNKQQKKSGRSSKWQINWPVVSKMSIRIFSKPKRKVFASVSKQLSTTGSSPSNEIKDTMNQDDIRQSTRVCFRNSPKEATLPLPKPDESRIHKVSENKLSKSQSTVSDNSIGETAPSDARAVHLLEELPTPLCCLRGLDLFRTEDADPDMITHPYLLQYVFYYLYRKRVSWIEFRARFNLDCLHTLF